MLGITLIDTLTSTIKNLIVFHRGRRWNRIQWIVRDDGASYGQVQMSQYAAVWRGPVWPHGSR
jgi:hypothetical protein